MDEQLQRIMENHRISLLGMFYSDCPPDKSPEKQFRASLSPLRLQLQQQYTLNALNELEQRIMENYRIGMIYND